MIDRSMISKAVARQAKYGDELTERVLLQARDTIDLYRDALEFVRNLGMTAAQDPGSALRKATEVAESALAGRPVI